MGLFDLIRRVYLDFNKEKRLTLISYYELKVSISENLE